MAKERTGTNVSVYLSYEARKYIDKRAKQEKRSKSDIINELILEQKQGE